MNAKSLDKTVKVSISAHEKLASFGVSIKDNIELMADWIAVFDTCQKLELSIDEAIARLNQSYIPSKAPRSSKNRDEFSNWLEKLIQHNENSPIEKRVFLTQRLFLNLIGGNVNTISESFKRHAAMIAEHNARMEIDESVNRKLSHVVRKDYGTVTDWLKKILS